MSSILIARSMNFAITGLGRSGTTFLSKLMNQSQVWSVLHEPGSHCDLLENIQKRFGDHYGEVNRSIKLGKIYPSRKFEQPTI